LAAVLMAFSPSACQQADGSSWFGHQSALARRVVDHPASTAEQLLARITRSVSVSVTADVEAGYGLPPDDLVERLLDAGAVGCNLEDTDHHGAAGLVDAGEHAERLRAVRHAAAQAGVDVVLNARVDVLRREGDRRELFEEPVRRATVPSGGGRLRVPRTARGRGADQ
jgi:2-methylisocitrate lyase-like PEP mutase family enzyme